MNLVHTAVVTPHRAGLYETVRDLVAAEVALGHDACIVDPKQPATDRGAPLGHAGRVEQADVIVNHSGLGPYNNCGKPVVHCLHGRPESSFRLEQNGTTPVLSFLEQAGRDPQYKAFVTFWAEHVPYWELIIGNRVRCLPAPVDLAAWTPDGPSGYKFGGKRGQINVALTDMWREDVTPFHCLFAFVQFAAEHEGAKLHLYGVQRHKALDVILRRLDANGWLGEVTGYVSGLANVYRAADFLLTPHTIATRARRESLACGCPAIYCGPQGDLPYYETDWGRPFEKGARDFARKMAHDHDARTTAAGMIQICEEAINAAS